MDVATQSNSPTKKVLSRTGVQIYHAPEAEVTPEPASTPGAEESKVGESVDDETDSKASGETNNSIDDDTDLPVEK